jgi:hypothetical protein
MPLGKWPSWSQISSHLMAVIIGMIVTLSVPTQNKQRLLSTYPEHVIWPIMNKKQISPKLVSGKGVWLVLLEDGKPQCVLERNGIVLARQRPQPLLAIALSEATATLEKMGRYGKEVTFTAIDELPSLSNCRSVAKITYGL